MGGQTCAPRRELAGDGEAEEEAPFHYEKEDRRRDPEAPWEQNGNVRGRIRGRQMPRGETGIIRTLVEQDNDYVFRRRGRAGGPRATRVFLTRFYSTSPALFYLADAEQCGINNARSRDPASWNDLQTRSGRELWALPVILDYKLG